MNKIMMDGPAIERVIYYMQKIAENDLAGTATGDVLDDVLGSLGKMIRPRLLLLCGAFGPKASENFERLCMLAAMVELTHMASLVHDDIIDEAPIRRGKPSIQGKYGKDAAVFAGDFLIVRIHYWQAKERLFDAAMLLSKTVEALCAGEIGQAAYRYHVNVKTEDYMRNIRGKTASLFRTACVLGAREAGCSTEVTEKFRRFGEYVGIMFQFRDDLLDFTSSNHAEGKATHKDFHDGIYTMPVLKALEAPEGRKVLLPIMEENGKRNLSPDEIREMEKAVIRFGGTRRTVEDIHHYAALAREILYSLEEIPEARTIGKILDILEAVD